MELLFGSYERKSTDNRDKQQQSLDTQDNWRRREVEINNYNIVERYIEAESATKSGIRTEFYRMIEDIHEGKINAIMTYEVDRLARNFTENSIIQTLSQEGKILLIHTATGKFFPNDILHLGMKSLFAVYESHQMKKKMADGRKRTLEKGKYLGGVFHGYKSINKELVIDQEEAVFVKMIYDLRFDGKSIREIVKIVNEKGFKSRDRKTKDGNRIEGGKASKMKVERIMKDPIYIGMVKHDGELYSGGHEPIIDIDTWEFINKDVKKIPRRSGLTPLKGKVFHQGKPLTVSEIKKKYIYFHKHSEMKGNNLWFNQSKIIKYFDENISDYVIPEKFKEEFLEYCGNEYKNEFEKSKKLRSSLEKQHREKMIEVDGLTTMRAGGELTKEEYLPKKNKLMKKIKSLESQISKLTRSDEMLMNRSSESVELLFKLDQYWNKWTTDMKLQWIDEICVELVIDDKKRLYVEEKPTMKAFRECNNNEWWTYRTRRHNFYAFLIQNEKQVLRHSNKLKSIMQMQK